MEAEAALWTILTVFSGVLMGYFVIPWLVSGIKWLVSCIKRRRSDRWTARDELKARIDMLEGRMNDNIGIWASHASVEVQIASLSSRIDDLEKKIPKRSTNRKLDVED